jgi:phospholipid/cholesterol/gamma-HCH transport system permease protein
MLDWIQRFGAYGLGQVSGFGRSGLFFIEMIRGLWKPPGKFAATIRQIYFIGTKSFTLICFTGAFTGMVLGLQGYYTLSKVGSESALGAAVALSMIRELGPVLAALMVIGRAGSAMCAEIGIMRIEEQIDALECMAVNPHSYLVTPRLLAALLALPCLTAIFDVIGIGGGYLVGVDLLGVNPGAYIDGMNNMVTWADVSMGITKSIIFSVLIIWICTYKGFYAGIDQGSQGPEDVSRATTSAVVMASVAVLMSDYIATSVLL